MRALFFPVGEAPRPEDIPNTLEGIKGLLKVEWIDQLLLDRHVALVCDDEGLLNGSQPNLWAEGPSYTGAPIYGNALVVGFDRNKGDYRSIDPKEIRAFLKLKRFDHFEPGLGLVFK